MGSSLATLAGLSIWRATGERSYQRLADDALARAMAVARRSPFMAGASLEAMCELLGEG
jgi:hypothetical protein